MAQQAPSQAVELAKQGPTKLIASFGGQFAAIAPRHVNADAFMQLAAEVVRRDPKLSEAMIANPASLIVALRQCAALGHMPIRGQFALVPFNNRKATGGKEIVGVEEWRGTVQRILRAGGVQRITCDVVRDNDPVKGFNRVRDVLPRHEYDEFASPQERGPLLAVYAYAVLLNGGFSHVVWMNRHEVARHRAMSKTATFVGQGEQEASGGNFWGPEWPNEGPNTAKMWLKTALHELEGFVPASAAYLWEQQAAAQQSTGWPGVPDTPPRDPSLDLIEDAEIVDDPPAPKTTGAKRAPRSADTQGDNDWPDTATVPAGGTP